MRFWKFILFFSLSLPFLGDAFSSEVLSSKDLELLYSDQYFFSATRSLQSRQKVSDNVTVITREELDRWPVSDLDEALGYVNGIVVQDDGLIGQTATAQIQGSKAREVRVMVDGIPFNATTTGGIADLSQIPLDYVEKIEIIKGASSSVWGSAMGGVVNIITRPVGKTLVPNGKLTTSYGEFGIQRQRGELGGRFGPFGYYGMGNYTESSGFRPNSDELEKRGFLKAETRLAEDLVLTNSFGYSGSRNGEFELPDVFQSAKRKVHSRYGSSGLSKLWSETVKSDFTYKLSERSFRRDSYLYPAGTFIRHIRGRSMIHQASLINVWDIADNQTLVAGSDIDIEIYQDASFSPTATVYNANKESTKHAYYTNYQLSFWRLDSTFAARIDAANSYGVNFDPSFGTALRLPFWDSLLRANVARAFNAPSLVDRYASAGTTLANPDLEAENAITYNIGPEIHPTKWLQSKATFFQSFVRDSIQTITRSDGFRQPVNVAREKRTGFDVETALGPWFGFSPSYAVTYVKVVNSNDIPLMDRPRFTQDVKLNYHTKIKNWTFNAHLAGRYTDLVQYSNFTAPADQVMIVDGKIKIRLPEIVYGNFSLFLLGSNLFNSDFSFDSRRDPIPERYFESGIDFEF